MIIVEDVVDLGAESGDVKPGARRVDGHGVVADEAGDLRFVELLVNVDDLLRDGAEAGGRNLIADEYVARLRIEDRTFVDRIVGAINAKLLSGVEQSAEISIQEVGGGNRAGHPTGSVVLERISLIRDKEECLSFDDRATKAATVVVETIFRSGQS